MSNQNQGLSGMSTEELTQNLAMITLDRLGLEAQIEAAQNSLFDAKKAQLMFAQELSRRLQPTKSEHVTDADPS